MPLRDHFRGPLAEAESWDFVHGGWPMTMATALMGVLPPGFVAGPFVHLGASVEVDVGALAGDAPVRRRTAGNAGAATAWAPSRPTRSVEIDLPDADEYEVRVYDARRGRTLVAAVELVSPSNKDRPENRRAFAAKCAALVRQGVSVAVVDIVTERRVNLFGEMMALLGRGEASRGTVARLYAVVCRRIGSGTRRRLKTWEKPLKLGHPLPTLPLWLSDDLAVPLELEATYERTCQALGIA